MRQARFTKSERIYKSKEIDKLFDQGKSFLSYPLRVLVSWVPLEQASTSADVAILVSVSKRRFKRAVDRNRIKRCIREAYRLNKHLLSPNSLPAQTKLHICFMYVGNQPPSFAQVTTALEKALQQINQSSHETTT